MAVLTVRGNCSFLQKAANLGQAGAVVVILAHNESGAIALSSSLSCLLC